MSETTSEDGASDPLEWFSLVSTISIAIGIVLILFGLLIPSNYTFDATLPARQMEAIELFYFRLADGLVICLIIGMALVTLGGIIQTGMILHMYWHGELDPRPERPAAARSRGNEMTALRKGPTEGRNYGTRERRLGDDEGSGGRVDDATNDAGRKTVPQGLEGASYGDGSSELERQQPR